MHASSAASAEVIDLSSGNDSLLSVDTNDTSVHILSATIGVATPGRRASVRRISAICLTPDTPDLPSPSALLGVEPTRAPRQSLLVRSPTLAHKEDGVVGMLSRSEALDMPSSPPVPPSDDEIVCAFVDDESVSPPPPDFSSQFVASAVGPFQLDMATSILGRPRALDSESGASAVSTDILDSSSEDEYRRIFGSQRLVRRAQSMDDAVTISTDPPRLPSADSRTLHSDGLLPNTSSDSLSLPWLTGPIMRPPHLQQQPGGVKRSRRERDAEKREERERIKMQRMVERAQREQQRLAERAINSANRKKVDVRTLLHDMTVVADPGLPGMFSGQPPPSDPASTASEVDSVHPLFGALQQEGVAWRTEQMSPAASVRWEMRVRRTWDASLNLYVPLVHARVTRVRSVGMVAVQGREFVDMVAAERLARRLEIWRASLAVRRLLVVVVGLQKLMRRAATAETREFARQMRLHMQDDGQTQGRPRARRQQQQQADSAAAVTLSDEDVERALLKIHMVCPWTVWTTHCADAKALSKILLQTTTDLALSEYFSKGDQDADGFVSEAGNDDDNDEHSPSSTSFVTSDVAASLHAVAVRSGADLCESWVEALTQIPKVTKPVARSIAAQYPTPRRLFEAWDALASVEEREHMLAPLSVAGVAGGRRLGSAMSQRIYRMFNEADASKPFVEL